MFEKQVNMSAIEVGKITTGEHVRKEGENRQHCEHDSPGRLYEVIGLMHLIY